MKWLANQWHSAGTWVWPRRVCWLMLAQWEDVKPLQVLFHCWTWSWHWRLSISRNTARQALYHRVGICYGQVQSRWKGAGGWRRLHLVEMELDLMAWLEHDWMKWRVHRPPLKCLRIVSHRCGLIVWWNSRWRQTQRNLSIRTATDGNVLIAVDILTMNVYEIILDGTLSSTTKCPKIALMASTFLLPFVLDDADDFWISMTHQNVALVILPKTSHGPNPWHRPQGQQLLAGTSFGM